MKDERKFVTATLVPEDERLDFMPRYFGNHCMNVEVHLYNWMDNHVQGYGGGYWEFYRLSNGGPLVCMNEERPVRLVNPENYFDSNMTLHVASVIGWWFTLNWVTWQQWSGERHVDMFYGMREWVLDSFEGPNRDLILSATD